MSTTKKPSRASRRDAPRGSALPETKSEWQNAVDAAHGALVLDAARQYGLVTGGPKVNAFRCDEIIRLGKSRGVTPAKDAVERFLASVQNCVNHMTSPTDIKPTSIRQAS